MKPRGLNAVPWRAVAAVACGLMLAAAFPPFSFAQAGWMALVPIVVIARFSAPRVAFRWGFLAGLVFWGLTLIWLRRLADYETPWVAVGIAWLALAGYCALYTGMFAAATARLWTGVRRGEERLGTASPSRGGQESFPGVRNVGRMVAMALLWVGFEYVRSTFCTGFAWNALGISQYRNLGLIQIAEWGGVYAVSALLVLVNAALAITAIDFALPWISGERARPRIHIELFVATVCVLLTLSYGQKRVRALRADDARHPPVMLQCASVQGNVAQDDKWSEELERALRDRLIDLTQRAAIAKPDLIIWPETSVPILLTASASEPTFMNTLASEIGVPLLVGAIEVDDARGAERYFNSAFLYGGDGGLEEVYRKQHLVPFGEYIPLGNVIPALERFAPLGYSCVSGTTGTVFRLAASGVPFTTLICFEDTIAGLARRAVRNGVRLLINQTNDAWFKDTCAAVQHMSHCVFRCVENRVPAVRCANFGVSCIIDRTGALDGATVEALAGRDTHDTLFRVDPVSVPAAGKRSTFYTRFGDLPFALPAAVMALATLAQGWRRNCRL